MAYCANCGTMLHEGYEFCPECGKALSNNSKSTYVGKYKTCQNCGEQMPEDAFYCLCCGMTFDNQAIDFEDIKKLVINTGKPQRREIDTTEGVWKNKWVSLILCVFFGVFGIHRFYEEKKITGFIYLFTFGLLGFGWLFDIILIATKTNPYRVK